YDYLCLLILESIYTLHRSLQLFRTWMATFFSGGRPRVNPFTELSKNFDGKNDFKSEFLTKFRPIRILGQGCFASVIEAEFNMIKKSYAVKRIPLRSDYVRDDRMKEVNALALLDHPGIARFHNAWTENPPPGWQLYSDRKMLDEMDEWKRKTIRLNYHEESSFLYIQMEVISKLIKMHQVIQLFERGTLADWLANQANNNRDVTRMKSWFRQIVSAVAYIHANGFVHRKIKTRNVYFYSPDTLKISGLVAAEQFELRDGHEAFFIPVLTSKMDIFAMGLVLIEMLIAISSNTAEQEFFNIRRGIRTELFSEQSDEGKFVAWLTNVEYTQRPTCREILDHPFLGGYTSRFFVEFTVTKLLGAGGFGCVFRATNKSDRAEYAVKRIPENKSDVEHALNEVRQLAALDHEGIVRYNHHWIEEPPKGWQHKTDHELLERMESSRRTLNDYEIDSVFIYIQMKLYKKSLTDWLKENQTASSRSLPQIKSWFKQIVEAVRYLHINGIIHSDLKPCNILLDKNDEPKLCDFGLAKERKVENGQELTISRSSVFTQLYSSPEQSGWFTQFSSKTDVFALGLILTELCVVMDYSTFIQRSQIFDSYRQGRPNRSIFKDAETAKFVARLAAYNSKHRPTCEQILSDPFLGGRGKSNNLIQRIMMYWFS
ncbi:hypothetical protein PMAYCL1PPCAC_00394, partial [Pristionchus mayeri]